jgi:hypothetical protein
MSARTGQMEPLGMVCQRLILSIFGQQPLIQEPRISKATPTGCWIAPVQGRALRESTRRVGNRLGRGVKQPNTNSHEVLP